MSLTWCLYFYPDIFKGCQVMWVITIQVREGSSLSLFWHNSHACFSLMSQAGDFQLYRGETELSTHPMCPRLVRGIHWIGHLTTCLHVSNDANMTSLSLGVSLVCRQLYKVMEWDLERNFWLKIHFVARLQAENCRKEFTFNNCAHPWSRSMLF
jgi:hypothetical protein